MVTKTNRLERLKRRSGKKESISITINQNNLNKARKLLEGTSMNISNMFDMFLEDFIYEELSEKEQDDISDAELKDLKSGGKS